MRLSGVAVALACCVAFPAGPLVAQCPDGTPPPCAGQRPPAPAPNSVAVLTFENVTRDTSAQYLAEGLADQVFTRLGAVGRLTMVSRTAVRRLRNADQLSVQQIGRALNVAYLVSGSIRAAGGRVRVNAEALRAATGEAVWSSAYDRASDDLVGLEEAIATEVAQGVAGRLSPKERRALGRRLSVSGAAYDQFLHGNVLLARRSPASLQGAIAAYRAATAADSGFADAFGRLAYAYALCATWECANTDSLLSLGRQAAAHALQIAPRSSDAWLGRAADLFAWVLTRGNADDSLLAALAGFRRAVELNPRNDEAWHQMGDLLEWLNDSASIDAFRHALALDPSRAVSYGHLSLTLHVIGRNDAALATMDSALALEPEGAFRSWRVLYLMVAGDTTAALADARKVPGISIARAALAALAHDTVFAREFESGPAASLPCPGTPITLYRLWAGRREQAAQSVLQCPPSLMTRWQLRLPSLASLADDPRIRDLRAACDSILARARWQ